MSKKPEDMIADDQTHAVYGDTKVRMGTMAALMANIEIYQDPKTPAEEKQEVFEQIKQLVEVVKTSGISHYVVWKNPDVESLFSDQ